MTLMNSVIIEGEVGQISPWVNEEIRVILESDAGTFTVMIPDRLMKWPTNECVRSIIRIVGRLRGEDPACDIKAEYVELRKKEQ